MMVLMVKQSQDIDEQASEPLPYFSEARRGKDPSGTHRRDPLPTSRSNEEAGVHSLPEQWLTLHGDALFRYALVLVSDQHRAEDLVQETLLAAIEGRGRYSGAASERTWLVAILRNKVVDERRRERLQSRYLADSDLVVEENFNRIGKWRKPPSGWTPNPEELVESKEFWAVFNGCMRMLPVHMREAFALRVIEDLDAAETCRMLDISSTNLWTLLFRARERLRRCLERKWFIREEV